MKKKVFYALLAIGLFTFTACQQDSTIDELANEVEIDNGNITAVCCLEGDEGNGDIPPNN